MAFVWARQAFNRQLSLNDMKSNFVSSVSHELRAPIASVRLMAESLERGKISEPAKQNEYFRFIGQECRRLSSLIENVLDFARLEQGRAAYEFTAADLGTTVRRDVEAFRFRAHRERPALVTEIAEGIAPVRLDARALQVLLFNLLDNAFKYAGDTDAVFVRARQEGSRAILEVEDRGPGIDPDDARKIFERFYRGRAVRSGGPRGTGIGLSLVQHIARAHGGDVTVHPATPSGTVFRVAIPVAR